MTNALPPKVEEFILEVLADPERRENLITLCKKYGFREEEPEEDQTAE